jgi:predicted nucleic acid-binding protein
MRDNTLFSFNEDGHFYGMRIYLDTCCFNRPFDDQTQDRIRLESEAVRLIFYHVETGEFTLIGSEMLRFEVEKIPDEQKRNAILVLMEEVNHEIPVSFHVLKVAEQLESAGVNAYDAIHIACAFQGKADVFLTVDHRLCRIEKKVHQMYGLRIVNPLLWIQDWEDIGR